MINEQLHALFTGYGELTSRIKQACLGSFNSWSPSILRAQIKGLAESKGFWESE